MYLLTYILPEFDTANVRRGDIEVEFGFEITLLRLSFIAEFCGGFMIDKHTKSVTLDPHCEFVIAEAPIGFEISVVDLEFGCGFFNTCFIRLTHFHFLDRVWSNVAETILTTSFFGCALRVSFKSTGVA